MNSVFGKYEQYTNIGLDINKETIQAISPIFIKYMKLNIPIREISHIILHTIQGIECENVLKTAMIMRKKERNN